MSLIEDFLGGVTDRFDQGIDSDESVVFYPSIGTRPHDGADCRVEIRGRIFEKRRGLRELTSIALGLVGVPDENAFEDFVSRLPDRANCIRIFKQRIKDFIVDGESLEHLDVDIVGSRLRSHRSDLQGFFGLGDPSFAMAAASFGSTQTQHNPWIEYIAGKKGRSFKGRSQLLSPHGAIVVSDIDDTIKDSNVPETAELIANTLFRPFRSTPGMAETYQAWEKSNVQFIYLTNSPYQLFSPLAEYLQGEARFPHGAYYLRPIGPDDFMKGIAKLVACDDTVRIEENPKKHNLIPVLEAFPNRSFVLVGDSTEFDADVYADLYLGENFPSKFRPSQRGYRDRIKKIYIRDVPNAKTERRKRAVDAIARIGDSKVAMFFDAENPRIQQDAAPVILESLR
jgi:Phosphatidate phosphatase APP1, catalytic domain